LILSKHLNIVGKLMLGADCSSLQMRNIYKGKINENIETKC